MSDKIPISNEQKKKIRIGKIDYFDYFDFNNDNFYLFIECFFFVVVLFTVEIKIDVNER